MSTSNRTIVEAAINEILNQQPVDVVVNDLVEVSLGKLAGAGLAIGAGIGGYRGYKGAKSGSKLRGTLRGAAKGALGGAATALVSGLVANNVQKIKTAISKAALSAAKRPVTSIAASGGIAVTLDLLKTRGIIKDSQDITAAIRTKKSVDSKKFVRKIDKKIVVVTNSSEIYSALKRERKLVAQTTDDQLRYLATTLGNTLRRKVNAFAISGEDVEIVGVPARTSAHVIAHEIGHIIDFREKGYTIWEQGSYEHTFSSVILRYKYEQQVMTPEREAWDKSPSKEDDEKKKTRTAALGTYDKGFYLNRAILVGWATIFALVVATITKQSY